MLIDSHCHLDFEDFAVDREAAIERARAAGIERMIAISTWVKDFATIRGLAEAHDDIFCTVGTHPHNAAEEQTAAAELVALARHPKCVGIGEAGLDYHYDSVPREIAARVFRTHIAAARQSGLPLVVHAREADADVAAILQEEMEQGAFRAVLHCFTASRRLAEIGLALGFYISFSGVLTFKKSDELRAIARDVPIDRLLIETDAPFLAPVPYRGNRNEPVYVVETAKILAKVRGLSEAALAATTSANTLRLFSKMSAPRAAAAQ